MWSCSLSSCCSVLHVEWWLVFNMSQWIDEWPALLLLHFHLFHFKFPFSATNLPLCSFYSLLPVNFYVLVPFLFFYKFCLHLSSTSHSDIYIFFHSKRFLLHNILSFEPLSIIGLPKEVNKSITGTLVSHKDMKRRWTNDRKKGHDLSTWAKWEEKRKNQTSRTEQKKKKREEKRFHLLLLAAQSARR